MAGYREGWLDCHGTVGDGKDRKEAGETFFILVFSMYFRNLEI